MGIIDFYRLSLKPKRFPVAIRNSFEFAGFYEVRWRNHFQLQFQTTLLDVLLYFWDIEEVIVAQRVRLAELDTILLIYFPYKF